ncbi:helix-turn-helix domain-containing protein [Streptomyces mirabilis]|uniref:helix-turn-helix domain-containing protein n=1 Tax=Streptomyces mirabilis TaxID=68239 RepID=UPI0036635000
MQLRYAFRLDPGSGQRVALARAFGCARVVYNDAVAARERARREGAAFPSAGVLSRTLITEAKQSRERQWLSEVSAVILRGQRDRQVAAMINVRDRGRKTVVAGMMAPVLAPRGGHERGAPRAVQAVGCASCVDHSIPP